MQQIPAGWYPDPSRRYQFRYWDGGAWTRHVATNGVATEDPHFDSGHASGPRRAEGGVEQAAQAQWPAAARTAVAHARSAKPPHVQDWQSEMTISSGLVAAAKGLVAYRDGVYTIARKYLEVGRDTAAMVQLMPAAAGCSYLLSSAPMAGPDRRSADGYPAPVGALGGAPAEQAQWHAERGDLEAALASLLEAFVDAGVPTATLSA
ncbi:MAG: DUF2510 domain-containing protein [Acidimicrobiia bacterium]